MTIHEEDGLQLPPALRMAANPSRGKKFVVEREGSAHSSRTMESEEKGPLLPSTLRIAASSGLGKKQKKHGERAGLKNEAHAMRLRLAEMDGKTDSVSPGRTRSARPTKSFSAVDTDRTRLRRSRTPTKSRSIDVSRSRKTRNSRPTKSRSIDTLNTTEKGFGSSGKYSNEILHKKIKKVTKMLNESTPGSKEHKSLSKKLTDYRSQLNEQRQNSDDDGSRSEPFNISEIEAKTMTEEQDDDVSKIEPFNISEVEAKVMTEEKDDPVSEEFGQDESEVVNENPVEAKVQGKEEQDAYSLELLQKKMKKLDKMMRKSVPGSKEYKKLQKKRTEYENQIRGKDANDTKADEKDRDNRLERAEHRDSVRNDTESNQSGLSSQTSEEEPETKPSPINYYTKYGEDEKSKKQAFLEEARQLKREAMERKKRDEESRATVVEESRSESSEDQSESSEDQSESSEKDEVSKYEFATQTSQSKKQAYLEEARQLKREALEKKRRAEEDSLKKQDKTDMNNDEKNICTAGVPTAEVVQAKETEEQRRKKAYLEEARQLKRDALEKKKKQEEFHLEDNETAETSDTESHSEEENFDYDDSQQRKEAYLEEARQLKREADMKDQPVEENEDNKQESQENASALPIAKPPDFLAEMKSKACAEREKDQSEPNRSDDSSAKIRKANFLSGITSKRKGRDSTESSDAVSNKKKPNFLAEMMSKAKGEKKEKSEDDLTKPSDPTKQQATASFLDEIRSKATISTDESTSNPSTNLTTITKKPNFLEEIKSRAGTKNLAQGQGSATQPSVPPANRTNPNFLDEIKSKASRSKDDEKQNANDSSLLEEVRSMAGGMIVDEQANVSSSNSSGEFNDYSEGTAVLREQIDENGIESKEPPKEEGAKDSTSEQKSEASKAFLDRRTLPQPLSSNSNKILRELEANEVRQKKLERSLIQNGISIIEEIPYEVAREKIAEITESMKSLVERGLDYSAEKEYFRLEEQLSKFTTALMLTDEYAVEVRRMEQQWEESIQADNIAAIQKIRSHMPVNIRHLTEDQLVTTPTPNGKTLPRPIARKFKRTNILQLLRVDPNDIEMMHPSLLEGMRTTSLTLTERRALHEHLKDVVERWTGKRADPSIEKKWQWYQTLKLKFKETLSSYSRGDQWTLKAEAAVDYGEDYGYTKEATYENSDRIESKKESPAHSRQVKEKLSKAAKCSEADAIQEFRASLRLETEETVIDKKLLRELYYADKRTKSLEKQLTQAGLSLPKEDISYDVAKTRITELTGELNKVALSMGSTVDKKQMAKLEHKFGLLSQDLDKYTNAIMLTKEWVEEQQEKERQWESEISVANYEALQKVLRHMPVNIRNISENSLATDLTPNGNILPKAIGRKFKRTNILMILRTDPSVIESMHPSSLEAMRTTGLTLTERRAIHEHLKFVAPKWKAMTSDKMCERKWMWHASLQSKLKEMLKNPSNVDDYSGDYGYPDTPVYEQQTVAKSNLLSMEELERRRAEEDW